MFNDDTYRIQEGGVCGAFSTSVVEEQARKVVVASQAPSAPAPNWTQVPRPGTWQRVAEVVDDINGGHFVPTRVLRDTLDMVRREKGDEPSEDQQSAVTLVEDELKNRDQDGYDSKPTKDLG